MKEVEPASSNIINNLITVLNVLVAVCNSLGTISNAVILNSNNR